jgi:hypothetical protein
MAFAGDHEQRVFLAIYRMRREGMPEMRIVPRLELFLNGEIHTERARPGPDVPRWREPARPPGIRHR